MLPKGELSGPGTGGLIYLAAGSGSGTLRRFQILPFSPDYWAGVISVVIQ